MNLNDVKKGFKEMAYFDRRNICSSCRKSKEYFLRLPVFFFVKETGEGGETRRKEKRRGRPLLASPPRP